MHCWLVANATTPLILSHPLQGVSDRLQEAQAAAAQGGTKVSNCMQRMLHIATASGSQLNDWYCEQFRQLEVKAKQQRIEERAEVGNAGTQLWTKHRLATDHNTVHVVVRATCKPPLHMIASTQRRTKLKHELGLPDNYGVGSSSSDEGEFLSGNWLTPCKTADGMTACTLHQSMRMVLEALPTKLHLWPST